MTEQSLKQNIATEDSPVTGNSSQAYIRMLGIELMPLELRSGRWVLQEWQIREVWPESQFDGKATAGEQTVSADNHPITWLPLELYRDERSAYRFNLNSVVPHLFILCDDSEDDVWQPRQITACQDLAASWLDGEQKVLEYPMPEALQCWIEAFITEHGELIEVKKKKRYAGEGKDKAPRDGTASSDSQSGTSDSQPSANGTQPGGTA